MEKKNNLVLKLIPLFGILSVIFYSLHVILGEIFYEGYNPFAQAVSDLTASNSLSKNIARTFSMLYGICVVTFTVGLFIYFKNKINKVIAFALFIFYLMNIISFFGYTFFPLSESGYAGALQDKMHIIVTIFVVLLSIISLILYAIGFFRSKRNKWLGIVSICTLLLLMAGAILINILPKEYFGIAERINIYSIIIYTGILSLWMYNNLKKSCTNKYV